MNYKIKCKLYNSIDIFLYKIFIYNKLGNKIIECESDNLGITNFILNECGTYKLEIIPIDKKINKYCKIINFDKNYPRELTFYFKKDCLNSSKITITLKDKYYNLPIQKGNIILWLNT